MYVSRVRRALTIAAPSIYVSTGGKHYPSRHVASVNGRLDGEMERFLSLSLSLSLSVWS